MSSNNNKQLDTLKQRLLEPSAAQAAAPATGPRREPPIDENTAQSAPLSRTTSRTKTVVPKRRRQTNKDAEMHSGTTYAAVLGDAIDIATLDRVWQRSVRGEASDDAKLDGEALKKIVNCVICMEKQVYLMTVFDDLHEVFVFNFGVIVGWGLTEAQFNAIIDLIRPLVTEPLKEILRDAVVYTTLAAREQQALAAPSQAAPAKQIRFDNINLNTTNYFEKLAYSYALGQSVKLDAFEDEVSATINDTQDIPVHLATHGAISLDNKTVTVKMGELFVQRCNVNLHSDILGTPDIFWDFDEFERMYVGLREYLDIDKRLGILNQRLDIMKEMYTILQNQLNVKHAHKLEMVVIILIVAEIFLQIVALVVTFFTKSQQNP
jgi:uncharacterized Rmd1/YagE family protein